MLTSTGLLAHLHDSVPPAKFGEPGFTPLSTAGCIEMLAIACPPKVDHLHGRRTAWNWGQFVWPPTIPKAQSAVLLPEASISARFFGQCCWANISPFFKIGNVHSFEEAC